MTRPRVLLDCDGVLADFIGRAIVTVNNLFGASHVPADVTQFDIATSLGLSAKQGAEMKRAIGSAPHFAAEIDVYPGAREGVRRLRAVSDVFIVTSSWDSNETWEFDRKAWLRKHFDIHHHEIVFTAAKQIIEGDILVDDKTSMCQEWKAAHPRGLAVQWANLHNRSDAWAGLSTSDWGVLVGWVTRCARGDLQP